MDRVREEGKVEIKIQWENVDILRFDDDSAVIANSEENMQKILNLIQY